MLPPFSDAGRTPCCSPRRFFLHVELGLPFRLSRRRCNSVSLLSPRSLSNSTVPRRSLSCPVQPHRPPLFLSPFHESFLSHPLEHLRCCQRNPVLYHCPSNCVCLRARLNFREYAACSKPNSCFFVDWSLFVDGIHPFLYHDVDERPLSRV